MLWAWLTIEPFCSYSASGFRGCNAIFRRIFTNGRSSNQCKGELLKVFVNHLVRECMIREHVVFNIHEEFGAIGEYVARVFPQKLFGAQGGGKSSK